MCVKQTIIIAACSIAIDCKTIITQVGKFSFLVKHFLGTVLGYQTLSKRCPIMSLQIANRRSEKCSPQRPRPRPRTHSIAYYYDRVHVREFPVNFIDTLI